MWCGAIGDSTILQLLIEAGGDVNQNRYACPPLFAALVYTPLTQSDVEANVRVLLRHPSLDLTAEFDGKTAEQTALDNHVLWLAYMIVAEKTRRVALSKSKHHAWMVHESYAGVRRLDKAGLAGRIDAPCVQAVFKSLRFLWVGKIVANCPK
jgi:hypothetical protein